MLEGNRRGRGDLSCGVFGRAVGFLLGGWLRLVEGWLWMFEVAGLGLGLGWAVVVDGWLVGCWAGC